MGKVFFKPNLWNVTVNKIPLVGTSITIGQRQDKIIGPIVYSKVR